MAWNPDSEPVTMGPELITDPSFELGLAEVPGNWERSSRADRETVDDAHDGVWIQDAEWDRTPGSANGRFGQRFNLAAGTESYPHVITFRARCTVATSHPDPAKYALDLVQFRLGLFPYQDPTSLHNVSDTEQMGEVRLDYLAMTGGAETLSTSLGINFPLDPIPPWLPYRFVVVPNRTDVLVWGLGDYIGPQGHPNPLWETIIEFDSFSMKQLFWDADADAPDPNYDPDTCDLSAFALDPSNASSYTRDPKW